MLPEGRSFQKSKDLLRDAIDIHIHAGPHLTTSPRSVTPVEAALQARRAGMKAIVYMDVFQMSNGTAQIVNEVVPDFKTYGGINLNTVFGGINPRAVRTSLTYAGGAKYVAFGTHSTHWMTSREGHYIDGEFKPFHTFDEKFKREELGRSIKIPVDEAPTPEIVEILEMVAAHPDVYLITGHVSAPEAVRLVELGHEYGIKKMVVSSTIFKIATMDQLAHMAELGAYIEYTLAAYGASSGTRKTDYYAEIKYASDSIPSNLPKTSVKTVAKHINELGAENCLIATDFGVYTLPPPVEGLREFIALLLDLGLTDEQIKTVVQENPAKLLGL
ncbi:MAG TPA: hypothetical protein ENJ36_01845 [Candidatus Bathyarchaeota archaeon]|nr:hypothetical protein [Candidatus Bathyarchaeota archaeon]